MPNEPEVAKPRQRYVGCDIHTHALALKVIQTSSCTHLLSEDVLQTLLGMGTGMNVTAHYGQSTNKESGISGPWPKHIFDY